MRLKKTFVAFLGAILLSVVIYCGEIVIIFFNRLKQCIFSVSFLLLKKQKENTSLNMARELCKSAKSCSVDKNFPFRINMFEFLRQTKICKFKSFGFSSKDLNITNNSEFLTYNKCDGKQYQNLLFCFFVYYKVFCTHRSFKSMPL